MNHDNRDPDVSQPTTQQMRADVQATSLRLVALDMRTLARGLAEVMPGKMTALTEKIDTWVRAVDTAAVVLQDVAKGPTR